MARLLSLFLLAALPFQVMGQEDQGLERRVTSLAHELRCLVCQNQTLADSNAPLAQDLRNQIREQLKAGKSERDVIDFMPQHTSWSTTTYGTSLCRRIAARSWPIAGSL